MAVAAKSRVYGCGNSQHGGLQVQRKAARLCGVIDSCEDLAQLHWARNWIDGNFLFRLKAAEAQVQAALLDRQRQGNLPAEFHIWAATENDTVSTGSRKRRIISWQAAATRIVQPPTCCPIQLHLRRRLDGFRLQTLPGR